MKNPSFTQYIMLAPLLCIFGCGGSNSPSPPSTNAIVATVQITPTSATIPVGTLQNFKAAAFNQEGVLISNTAFAWSSSDDSATISSSGVATGDSEGSAKVTATANGIAGQASVTVTPSVRPEPILTTVSISPIAATVPVGEVISYGAVALDQNGQLIQSPVDFTWSASPDGTIQVVTPTSIQVHTPNGNSEVQFTAGDNQGTTVISVGASCNGQTAGSYVSLTVVF